jgi:hypothetical protein
MLNIPIGFGCLVWMGITHTHTHTHIYTNTQTRINTHIYKHTHINKRRPKPCEKAMHKKAFTAFLPWVVSGSEPG